MNIRSKVTKYIRTSEARKIIGCDTREVRRLLREGIIRGIQDDNYVWYADKESVLKYVGAVSGPGDNNPIQSHVPNEKFELTLEQKHAKDIVENCNRHLLLLGKAGSGKTSFLKTLVNGRKKRIVVIAPSGIAAIEVDGVTIHSFFGFSVYNYNSKAAKRAPSLKKIDRAKTELINKLDTIIIDEISMVRADLLDKVDWALRIIRKNNKPFGGVQMVFVGDLRQLPPVVQKEEEEELKKDYPSAYFFDSKAFGKIQYEFVELNRVFRQSDDMTGANNELYELLERVRDKTCRNEDINRINSRYKHNAWKLADDNTVCLVTHKYMARKNKQL